MTILQVGLGIPDPVQIALGAAGAAALIAGFLLRARAGREATARRLMWSGVGLLVALLAYSLFVTWTMPLP